MPENLPLQHPRSKTDLFVSFTILALQGFGGVLAVVQRELVEKKRWMTREQFVEDWAVAQIMPGPNVINLALMIGGRYFGLAGALAGVAGMLAAPMVVVLLLAALCGSQVLANEPPRSRPVPIEYVSPGASGGVSGSSYSQRYDLYGGHAVPIQGYDGREVQIHSGSSVRQSGELVLFERGNTGQAVRASSSVPAVFQPVLINGREYVDGGLASPVPARAARRLGADVVIAVDISSTPALQAVTGSFDVLLQTFAIMGQAIAALELQDADVVIRPALATRGTDFAARNLAILEGEAAATGQLKRIQEAVERARSRLTVAPTRP